MDDTRILDLYWERSEEAIAETAQKYGRYCYSVAYGILRSDADAEEIVNDTYLKAWSRIPPDRPANLASYLGMICRQLSLNRCRARTTQKRGRGHVAVATEELEYCLPSWDGDQLDSLLLRDALNRFLRGLPQRERVVFLRRYWYLSTVSEIAADYSLTESNVKMILLRTRRRLKDFLRKEGINV